MQIRKLIYAAMVLLAAAALTPGFLGGQQPDGAERPALSAGQVAEGAAEGADADDEAEDLSSFRIGVAVDMVSVPVTVRKSDGSFIKGLKQKSFKVLEDGVPQEIVFFAQEGLPTHVAMVLDISGSVNHEWGSIKYAAKRFLEHLRPDDDFSLTTFNDEIRLRVNWGRNIARVSPVLTSVYCKGNTKLWDAIWVVSTEVFKGRDGKKVIIIMSDGLDNQSLVGYSDAVKAAVEAEVAIYVVSKTQALRDYIDPDRGIPPEIFARADAVLRRLAHDTGGRVLYPNNFGQLDEIYAEVDEELRNQYTLGYISTNAKKDGSYREIDVGVAGKGVVVSARPGYYAPKK
ncbi:MAG: VWA domain-containing protein [Acidobacteriota bacterium]|jgi:VWFA-related protein|nr:VWA domain-containing protein [Acidobacteriota bacterium]